MWQSSAQKWPGLCLPPGHGQDQLSPALEQHRLIEMYSKPWNFKISLGHITKDKKKQVK